ncbi:MAG: amino acid adenylation domain-containing protein, partial [Chloroflexi bacterium]|nr:amino acid adenylation domain-containing protein [Chloroflexota bacterium]
HEAETADKRLVAYVEPKTQNQEPREQLVADVRQHLRSQLPEYMIPTAFVVLDKLPLTPSGKLDRRAVPAPDTVEEATRAFVAPRTPTEELIANVWAAVLGRARISVHENFFSIGGHSLLATQVMSRLRQVLSLDLPLRLLFEAPTIAAFAAQLATQQAGSIQSIGAVPRDETPLPLSFAQQRLWFLDQLQPGSAAYHLPTVVRLTGALDVAALHHSLSALVARHESLRTVFVQHADQPIQRILPPTPVPLPVLDVPDPSDRATLIEFVRAQVQPPFDLAQGPLLRASLLRLAPDAHVLVLTLHHIVSDGWSQSVLLRELTTLYRGLVLDEPAMLPTLPIQYADYSVWQRQWLSGAVLEQQLGYWRQQLAGIQPLDLPTDRPRPPVTSERGGHFMFHLPDTLRTALNQLSHQLSSTLFMTLLAAWQTLLMRYSGQTDIAVGTPIAGRVRPELEGVVGFFVNTLVLRTELAGQPSFAELVSRVRTTALEAYAHQDLPFEQIVEAVQPARDLSRSPLFQVMFVLQNTPRTTIDLPELRLEPLGVETTTTKFDLTLALGETPDGLIATLEYSADLFDQTTIVRMAEHFQTLLAAIVADPQQSIATLPLLTDAEHQQLHAWNMTTADFPQDRCLHQLFEDQATRTPEAIAVVHQQQQFSYAELNRRANQIAHELQARGVRPEVRVGICAEPSIEMIAGLLGILKSGGAYIPLDPAYPQERLAFMAQDSRLQLVLTQQHLSERLPSTIPQIICLDRDWSEIARHSIDNPVSDVTSQNLAYLIYTSGSTGQPKGAMLVHQGVVNNLCWRQNSWPLDATDAMLQSYSVSFDPSVWNIFWPLMAGARLILLSAGEHADSSALVRLMHEQQVTVYGASPTLHAVLLDEPGFAQTKLRYVVSGGEPISAELQRRFFAQSSALFCNAYGPTEATIDATYWICPRVDDPQPAPIGRPLPNVQVHILDRQLQPVPIGVAGELYIGGMGVGRGYQDRPALTAERFVPNPFGAPGSRLYRTGDLVRYLVDGTIEFLGRIDHQIKLRGFRVELGEIEAALRQHPGVREAVVAVHSDSKSEKRLVAYVVGEQKNKEQNESQAGAGEALGSRLPGGHPVLGSAELRQHLGARLPEHMVPAAIMVLDALPLTPSGKLDRRALPAPDAFAESGQEFVAPRTPTEELIASVWAAVLGRERVGITDNFFTLGGHSLLATQAITRLRQVLSLDLPLRLLFEAPTIAAFAAQLAAQHTDQSLPLLPVSRDETPLPLSFAQQRLWFLDQLQPGSAAYHLPTVVRLTGALDVAALHHSLSALVARHESLRTVFAQHDGQPIQHVLPAAPVPLPILDVPDPSDHAALVQLVRDQVQPPFDLAHGPLLRATLLRLAPEAHVLVLTLHHIVSDGWSQSVLLRELTTLYRGFVLDQPVMLPTLPIQYADYSVWQRQWLQGAVLEQQLSYWRTQLAGIQPLELSTDRPRPPVTSERGAAVGFPIAPDVSTALVQLSQQLGATLFMTLLAAWQTLLMRYSGQTDIAVGTPIAGRVRPELEGVVGFFVNTLVLRTDLRDAPSFADLVSRVRTTALGAYAHQDLPFEMLVEAVQPARDLSRSPLFQVMFALQNTPRTTIDLPDLTLEAFGVEQQTAKFDLTLSVSDTPSGLYAALEYRTELFDPPTIARMAEHFQTLLAA